ncbi:MAG: WD40 repeat domain-containing protein [Clostridia bacterium]|nr:WD40 repeat domain-containing protein [Clostridia bacterium]
MKFPFGKGRHRAAQAPPEEEMSFTQKIGRFFSAEPQKEKVLRQEDFQAAGDTYYATVSAGYKIAQRLLWSVFIVFLMVSILVNHREITYDNFFYLIKDFSGAVDTDHSRYETLSYESDSRQNFVLYRGGLATVSPSKISVFTATGRRTYQATSSFSSPYAISSNRYVLIYDTSGNTFSVYNSFARVYTETLDYPVTDACFAEDGSFVIVTRSSDNRSVIRVYNKRFQKAAELRSDAFVFDIAADRERDTLVFLTYDAGNGSGQTTLSVRELSTLEEADRIVLEGEFPLACGFLEGNTLALMSSRYVRIYDSGFEERERSEDYSGGTLSGFSLNEEGVAVATLDSSQNRILAYDRTGKKIFHDTVAFHVSDVGISGSYLFLQTEQGVTRLYTADGSVKTLTSGHGNLLIYDEKTALVCGESKAEYLVFS